MRGLRSALQRNTLHYPLTIWACLAAQALPPERLQAQRSQDGFSAAERCARQWHEIDRQAYVALTQRQAVRQRPQAGPSCSMPRGQRHAMTVTDSRGADGRSAATRIDVAGLGHSWGSGGADQPFSGPQGPDASRLLWAFAQRQFSVPIPR